MKLNKKTILFCIVFFIPIIVSSCATLLDVNDQDIDVVGLPKFSGDTLNDRIKTNSISYVLGPDDIIHIEVDQHPEWSGDFNVKPTGKIVVPDLGEINVEDSSPGKVEQILTEYMSSYIKGPKVKVNIVKYASQSIYVLGEVEKPGRYSTEGKDLTIRDAVILAGLPTRYAATDNVFIISPSRRNPRKQVVNLYRILNRGELLRNVKLMPGDIVYVPKTLLGKVNDIFSVLLSPLTSTKEAMLVP
jgi:polysaccharide biosynthesis/export protein